ncbi:hypothetical protein PF005_g19716 [Phytophthora fragariae]|uniref:Uncharacterized protein n=2 Tax=Phytophthora TaxID=4783 RepID=A0A6A3J6X4_9STRA|nr:hypothetical protein PF003_g14114 [Phytophthora fragariae]KAE9013582.1 hypothetical protein PR002_g14463 [Phytophthora rubi]KAE8933536.1 hypothetical protein PF009_g16462 [Phytophthora fragariae]KAE8990102.1 hypothetical protein PF011_g18487 [Phytophthora fragariae]KAE9091040.1 hypothetical protein PF010_g18348 [Phytophthora fragariae]
MMLLSFKKLTSNRLRSITSAAVTLGCGASAQRGRSESYHFGIRQHSGKGAQPSC